MRKIKTLLKILRSFFEKNILGSFFKLLKIKKIILIESYPNFADSSLCVFNKMKKLGIDKDFKVIWVVGNTYDNPNNLYDCCYREGSFKNRINTIKLLRTAAILISTNNFMISYRKKQISLYIGHGTCIKRIRDYFTLPNDIDYILGTSPVMADVQCYQHNLPRKKAFICGFPRNDLFFEEKRPDLLLKMFGKKYDKTILWLPTFRQHKTGVHSSSSTAIPLLDSEENAVLINNHLKEKNILVIVKPHFAQDISFIKHRIY